MFTNKREANQGGGMREIEKRRMHKGMDDRILAVFQRFLGGTEPIEGFDAEFAKAMEEVMSENLGWPVTYCKERIEAKHKMTDSEIERRRKLGADPEAFQDFEE